MVHLRGDAVEAGLNLVAAHRAPLEHVEEEQVAQLEVEVAVAGGRAREKHQLLGILRHVVNQDHREKLEEVVGSQTLHESFVLEPDDLVEQPENLDLVRH